MPGSSQISSLCVLRPTKAERKTKHNHRCAAPAVTRLRHLPSPVPIWNGTALLPLVSRKGSWRALIFRKECCFRAVVPSSIPPSPPRDPSRPLLVFSLRSDLGPRRRKTPLFFFSVTCYSPPRKSGRRGEEEGKLEKKKGAEKCDLNDQYFQRGERSEQLPKSKEHAMHIFKIESLTADFEKQTIKIFSSRGLSNNFP